MTIGVIWRMRLFGVFAVCMALVVSYQMSRSGTETRIGQPFVPSPQFFLDFSPSYRATIADAYWLQTIQYYGEHVRTDQKFDSLEGMIDLVTTLSPHFQRGYLFGAYALLDSGMGNEAYRLLERGFKENPAAWKLATNAGILMYIYGPEDVKTRVAAKWFERAAAIPQAPDYVPRIAARLLGKGGALQKSIALYAEIYATGDEYSREKALKGLDEVLPASHDARRRALERARDLVAPKTLRELKDALLGESESP